jgi:hypothetical protein
MTSDNTAIYHPQGWNEAKLVLEPSFDQRGKNRVVNILDNSGNFIRRINNEGLSPTQIVAFRSGEIAVFYLSTSPSENTRETPSLVSVFDKNGSLLRKFAAPRMYEDPATNFWCNSAGIAGDDLDNIYVNFESQNRIEKYSAEGKLLFKADRLLGYPETAFSWLTETLKWSYLNTESSISEGTTRSRIPLAFYRISLLPSAERAR